MHETDFIGYGAEGFGVVEIEHIDPKSSSTGKARINDYTNLVLICCLCNSARGKKPILGAQGQRLLDPTADAWEVHFEWQQDHLLPITGDQDAGYTHEAYKLNGAPRVRLRRERRQAIERSLEVLKETPGELTTLRRLLLQTSDSDGVKALRQAINRNRQLLADAGEKLRRRVAVPTDADASCRCKTPGTQARTLPSELARQVISVQL